jgi:hypothetical protein
MNDITLCDGLHCPIAEQCERYLPYRPTEEMKSYFVGVPYNHNLQQCHMFYEKPKEAA